MKDTENQLPSVEQEDWDSIFAEDTTDEEHPETDSEVDAEEATEEENTPAGQDAPEVEEEPSEDGEEETEDEAAEEETEEDNDTKTSEINDDLEIDMGEGRQPVKLGELKKGYLRQSDYTKKTQDLARQREEVERQAEELKPVQAWLEDIKANPYLFDQIDKAIREYKQSGVLPIDEVLQDAEYSKYINYLWAENNQLKQKLDSLERELNSARMETMLKTLEAELKGEYGDLVTSDYLHELREKAEERGYTEEELRKFAIGDLAPQKLKQAQEQNKKAKREAEAKTIQSIQEKRKKLPPQPKQKAQRPVVPEGPIETWEDVFGTS